MLDGFTIESFSHDGVARDVYRCGQGPAVVVMHEIPGITPEVARFSRIVADAGFTVFMPHLFGVVGKPNGVAYTIEGMLRACVSREFHVLAARDASPVTDWLRALCKRVHEEIGGRGVGAIGMCLTGNFALTLMVDPWLMAPVLSQPSLPFSITPSRRAALHVRDDDLAVAKRRAKEEGVRILGLRFTGDPLCPGARFDTLRAEFRDAFEAIEIDSSIGNRDGISPLAHSVVTRDLLDREGHPTRAALDRVLAFFRDALG